MMPQDQIVWAFFGTLLLLSALPRLIDPGKNGRVLLAGVAILIPSLCELTRLIGGEIRLLGIPLIPRAVAESYLLLAFYWFGVVTLLASMPPLLKWKTTPHDEKWGGLALGSLAVAFLAACWFVGHVSMERMAESDLAIQFKGSSFAYIDRTTAIISAIVLLAALLVAAWARAKMRASR